MNRTSTPPNDDSGSADLTYSDNDLARQLFGEHNNHLKQVEKATDVTIDVRGNTLRIRGDTPMVELAENVLDQLYGLLKEKFPVFPADIDYAINVLSRNDRAILKEIFLDTVYITCKKRSIAPKSPAQKAYIEAMRHFDIVFGIGPAGTGKTYLAMAMAVSALTQGRVRRIIQDKDGTVIYFGDVTYRGDYVKLRITVEPDS